MVRIVSVPESWRSSLRIVGDVTSADLAHFLTLRERDDVEGLKAVGRRLERAASRIAGKLLLEEVHSIVEPSEIEFVKQGDRPSAILRGQPAPFSISFTHSHGLGAAATCDGPVGVDLEGFRTIRREMTRFFLSPAELACADSLEIENSLLHFWSAKESAFKLTDEFPTLLKVPLRITSSTSSGLTFEIEGGSYFVETRVIEGNFVAALARRHSG